MSGLGEPTFSLNHKRVYIAGINGMVGSAIARNLRPRKDLEVFGLNSTELDLLDRRETQKVLAGLDIDVLIMAAAKVGGIESNRKFPVEFINNNLEIQLNLLQSAHESGIERVLFLGSSCIYPRDSKQPIREEYLLTGQLEDTNRAYAIAKIAGIEQIQAYRREYGHKWISAMPCNLYGVGDYFNNERAHVIPGLLNRFEDAKNKASKVVLAWGSGRPIREFLYIDDLAQAIEVLLEFYDEDSHINIGSDTEVSIKELTKIIAEVVGFTGEIKWDASKPDGTPRKVMDNSRIHALGWRAKTSLPEGLKITYEWMKGYKHDLRY
jgi:GDP-L-fucose synthase